ncbi:MAG: hypothetical protein HFE65_00275 [Clostridiales bacterium]|jgi:hypothetical protein|nr:hypothetical protein [Clostridiales bacterium]
MYLASRFLIGKAVWPIENGCRSIAKAKDYPRRMCAYVKSYKLLARIGNWKLDLRENDVDTLLIEAWEAFSESAQKTIYI